VEILEGLDFTMSYRYDGVSKVLITFITSVEKIDLELVDGEAEKFMELVGAEGF
jgi:hypothetical protein